MLINKYLKYIVFILIVVVMFLAAVKKIYAVVVPAEKIKSAVVHYILKISEDKDLEFKVSVPNVFDIEIEGIYDPDIKVTHYSKRELGRSLPVDVEIKNDKGDVVKKVRLIARLKSFAVVAVLDQDVGRGEPINASEVVMKKVDVTSINDFYKSLSELNGIQAKKNMKAGTVLTKSNVNPIYLIKRGDKVNVEVREGDLSIHANGTARGNGIKGEYIDVYIDMTKTVISCKVLDSKTVITGVEGG